MDQKFKIRIQIYDIKDDELGDGDQVKQLEGSTAINKNISASKSSSSLLNERNNAQKGIPAPQTGTNQTKTTTQPQQPTQPPFQVEQQKQSSLAPRTITKPSQTQQSTQAPSQVSAIIPESSKYEEALKTKSEKNGNQTKMSAEKLKATAIYSSTLGDLNKNRFEKK